MKYKRVNSKNELLMESSMIDHFEKKAELLAKKSLSVLTAEEEAQLDALMKDDPRYEGFQQMLTDGSFVGEELFAMQQIDSRKAWKDMQQRIGISNKRQLPFLSPNFYRFAAAILVLIVGGAFWYYREYTRVTPPVITEEVQLAMEQSKESDKQGAEIITSKSSSQQVISEEERIFYHVDENFSEQLAEAKRITTYHDKEYWVTLDDGTLVHLDYNTRLIYPEEFGDRRDVILEGEAYFMVAKDKSRQFVVHTPQGDIKVYGTEFMVNTREKNSSKDKSLNSDNSSDSHATSVVLIKGSISFTPTDGKEQMLTSGQKLYIDNDKVLVNETDITPYVAWNTGLFVFKNSTLEDLMNVVLQWYDVKEVSFSNDRLRQMHFTGNLRKYGSIDRILDAIMMTCDLNIRIQDETIIIEDHYN